MSQKICHVIKKNCNFVANIYMVSIYCNVNNGKLGKNTVKRTMVTKVGVLTKDYILHVSYMYWSIKYQNYILNVILGIQY